MRLCQQFSWAFAILAIVCTAALFFFPAVRGSYSAVHGPVTALRSARTKIAIWLALAQTAFCLWGFFVPGGGSASAVLLTFAQLSPLSPSESNFVLRC